MGPRRAAGDLPRSNLRWHASGGPSNRQDSIGSAEDRMPLRMKAPSGVTPGQGAVLPMRLLGGLRTRSLSRGGTRSFAFASALALQCAVLAAPGAARDKHLGAGRAGDGIQP